ncbi:DUF4747 family protein [Aurantimonas sp. MSK8Z-1]|uniref:DUF4747 family protein n=1 Tax=Mangrovibrevibacter kandeliae TaxID=2968473 RepID=UPI00222E7506|nr:DUF4747 family protein [Aurantimonas sp. MSK8Z-1]MCW4116879.1 DUF4747 family protein [Aurantimonas sp. MSK8Z-1]
MPRAAVVEASAINVTLPDANETKYRKLIEDAYRSRTPVPVRGREIMMLTSILKPAPGTEIYKGTFARFTEIDPALPWFDLGRLDKAEADDLNKIVIPENLRPNFSSFFFRFDTKKHVFSFEARGPDGRVSAQQVEKFIRYLFSRIEPSTSVNLISDRKSVESIFSISSLKHLLISVELPNPDINEELERKIKERLRAQNVRRLVETFDALPQATIKPDEETRQLAAVATANGYVEGKGSEDGKPISLSTKSFPMKEVDTYDREHTTDRQAFDRTAERLEIRRSEQMRIKG